MIGFAVLNTLAPVSDKTSWFPFIVKYGFFLGKIFKPRSM